MNNKSKTRRLLIACACLTVIASVASKLLFVFSRITASDIVFTGSDKLLMKYLPVALGYASAVLKQLFIAAGICSVIYASVYLKKRTGAWVFLISAVAMLLGELTGFIYNMVYNSLSPSQLIAAIPASAIELIVTLAILLCAFPPSLSLRTSLEGCTEKAVQKKLRQAVLPSAVCSALINIADVTLFRVIPFFREYDDVRPDEIAAMAGDYIYCIGVYFLLPLLLSLPILMLYKRLIQK